MAEKLDNTQEQRRPGDVHRVAGDDRPFDEDNVAPTFVTPHDSKEMTDQPVVNPVIGGTI
jgi:hypothetical protein